MHSRFVELLIAFVVGASVGLGAFAVHEFSHDGDRPPPFLGNYDFRSHNDGGYTLINPLLECAENQAFSSEVAVTSLEAQVQKIIDVQKQVGAITFASVYCAI